MGNEGFGHRVGWIGTGRMGYELATRLLKAGVDGDAEVAERLGRGEDLRRLRGEALGLLEMSLPEASLRWILTQQRENFLPLKVIKDRLAESPHGVPSDAGWRSHSMP